MSDNHDDDRRHRAEEGDDAARTEAGVRELSDDELDDIAGGSGVAAGEQFRAS